MNRYTGFSDLCIPEANNAILKATVREAIELGYRNVAIEQVFDGKILNKDPKNKGHDPVPKPCSLKELKAEFAGQIQLFNRLTVMFEDINIGSVLNKSPNFQCYNIIAALPADEASLQHACQSMTCDIITYDNNTPRVKLHRKFYYLAVERNIAFEIKYAPTIVSTNARKATITLAHMYHCYGKSKNILISSEAKNAFQLRSPYDIANLGLIFGLSEEQSKRAIRDVPNRVLLSASGRRFGKAGVVIFRRARKENYVDSDDYSDGELQADISDVDDEDEESDHGADGAEAMDVTNCSQEEEAFDDLMEMQPPKKMKKTTKAPE